MTRCIDHSGEELRTYGLGNATEATAAGGVSELNGLPPTDVPLCACGSTRLHRVRASKNGPWILACALCSARLAEDNEEFVYGGAIRRLGRRALPISWTTPCQGRARLTG